MIVYFYTTDDHVVTTISPRFPSRSDYGPRGGQIGSAGKLRRAKVEISFFGGPVQVHMHSVDSGLDGD